MTILLFLFSLLPVVSGSVETDPSLLYGRVITEDGDIYEGYIRWDRNEVGWHDILDGSKIIRSNQEKDLDEDRTRIRIFGITIYEDGSDYRTRTSGIRMGHISSIEPLGGNSALLTLLNGDKVEFRNGASDIGNDNKGIEVTTSNMDKVVLKWGDVERIEFLDHVPAASQESLKRLYGQLVTRDGFEFTGFICWDVDEALPGDILDGDDEDKERRKIRFSNIESISRNSSSSALVRLLNQDELVLRGTNDVNSSNRGILVLDPNLGQVRVPWSSFDEVVFLDYDARSIDADFPEIYSITGKVYTRDGDLFSGLIRWDNDESESWELINGEMEDIEFDIELGHIRSIQRLSSRSSEITLHDGRVFELRGSNDVNDENDGIYIIEDTGEEYRINWRDFEKVVFNKF